jgi:exoribonuclease II
LPCAGVLKVGAWIISTITQLPTAVSAQDKIGRVDITDMKLVTIDGEDSRDFDDAVFAESTGNGCLCLNTVKVHHTAFGSRSF